MGNRTWFMDTIEKGLERLEEEKKLPGYFGISAINNRLSSLESEFGTYMDNGEDGEEWFEKK